MSTSSLCPRTTGSQHTVLLVHQTRGHRGQVSLEFLTARGVIEALLLTDEFDSHLDLRVRLRLDTIRSLLVVDLQVLKLRVAFLATLEERANRADVGVVTRPRVSGEENTPEGGKQRESVCIQAQQLVGAEIERLELVHVVEHVMLNRSDLVVLQVKKLQRFGDRVKCFRHNAANLYVWVIQEEV